jgi:hypothetical protein
MSNIIWTKHAQERNKGRQITVNWIESSVNHPDSYSEIEGGKLKSFKNFGKHNVTVITTKTDEGKYLILSAWVNPPIIGTDDYKKEKLYKNLKKASSFKKLWLTLKAQLGF